MNILSRTITDLDLPLLAAMNKRLIEDEGSRNPMTIAQLQDRMRGWWTGGQVRVRIFEEAQTRKVVGYAVYTFRVDEYFPDQPVVYLRQLYVEREMRSQGIGQQALDELIRSEFPPACRVEIDVLTSNPRGQAFWKRLGFEADYVHMHLKRHSSQTE